MPELEEPLPRLDKFTQFHWSAIASGSCEACLVCRTVRDGKAVTHTP